MRRIALALSVLVLLSLACNLSSIGLITQADHNREVGDLQSRLLETQAALVSTQAELAGAESLIRELGEDLVDYRSLFCENHTWEDFWGAYLWYPEEWYEDEVFRVFVDDWQAGIMMTQWQPWQPWQLEVPEWNQYMPVDLLVYDAAGSGVILNVTDDCLILNPDIWSRPISVP